MCYAFQKGKCKRGVKCRFVHGEVASTNGDTSSTRPQKKQKIDNKPDRDSSTTKATKRDQSNQSEQARTLTEAEVVLRQKQRLCHNASMVVINKDPEQKKAKMSVLDTLESTFAVLKPTIRSWRTLDNAKNRKALVRAIKGVKNKLLMEHKDLKRKLASGIPLHQKQKPEATSNGDESYTESSDDDDGSSDADGDRDYAAPDANSSSRDVSENSDEDVAKSGEQKSGGDATDDDDGDDDDDEEEEGDGEE